MDLRSTKRTSTGAPCILEFARSGNTLQFPLRRLQTRADWLSKIRVRESIMSDLIAIVSVELCRRSPEKSIGE